MKLDQASERIAEFILKVSFLFNKRAFYHTFSKVYVIKKRRRNIFLLSTGGNDRKKGQILVLFKFPTGVASKKSRKYVVNQFYINPLFLLYVHYRYFQPKRKGGRRGGIGGGEGVFDTYRVKSIYTI